jgi:hypothetical protein
VPPPTETPESAATLVPLSNPPTIAPTTKKPTSPACPVATGTVQFDLWNGDRDKPVVLNLKSGGSYCFTGNWNVRARLRGEPSPSCGAVVVSLSTKAGAVLHSKREGSPRYFLFGDNAKTGDVYGARDVKPRLKLAKGSTYCLKASDPRAAGRSAQQVCVKQKCSQ